MHHSVYASASKYLLFLYLVIGIAPNAFAHNLPDSRWPAGYEYTVKYLNFTPEISAEGGGAVKNIRGLVICYNAYDGQYQPCNFTAEIRRLPQFDGDKNTNGGHFHSPAQRDLTFKVRKVKQGVITEETQHLTYPWNTDKDKEPNRIESKFLANNPPWNDTLGGPYFYHPLQESAGYYEVEKIFYVPVGWGCQLSRDFIKYSHIHEYYRVSLEVDGLEELPTPTATDPYVIGRGPDSKLVHSDSVSFWGTPATNFYLRKIATLYQKLVTNQDTTIYPELLTKKLSINDISLPRGGLFDIDGDWDEIGGHSTHRNGKDADINRPVLKAGGRLACKDNYDLRFAVDFYLPLPDGTDGTGSLPHSIVNSALLCEGRLPDPDIPDDEGKKDTYHINFDVSLLDLLPINF